MEPFDFSVALRIERTRPHVGHTAQTNECFEVLGDELRAVVGDDSWARVGKCLARALDDNLDVGLGHRLADFPVNDVSAVAVDQSTEVVECAANVEV